jgi:hypothetical protein
LACGTRDFGGVGVEMMAIEIDYFAWEKWNHQNGYSNGYKENSYLKNGVLVASVFYFRHMTQEIIPCLTTRYSFWAESENAPITKLLRCSWQNRKTENGFLRHYYYDVIDIDEATAQAFHQDFSAMPSPEPILTEYFSTTYHNYIYRIDLGVRYGDKSYNWSSGGSDFHFTDAGASKIFGMSIENIINRCENLNAHRYPKTDALRQIIKAYEKSFRAKAKYMKYQGRWPKPKPLASYEGESFWQERKLLESFSTIDVQEWENFLDFKYYLSGFLKFMAFDEPFIQVFTAEHESILFSKLLEADLLTWDEDEQKAIHDYFLALFKYSLSYYPSITISASSLLIWLIKLEIDLEPFLVHWEDTFEHVDSLRHLGAFLEKLIEENLAENMPSVLSDWLGQASLEKALSDAISAYTGKRPYAHEFVVALENLQLIRAYQ